jgi:hypothetical protein
MKSFVFSTRFGVLAGMIFMAALSRLLPHPVNFTAIGAMALFSGAYLPKRSAIVVPLLAIWLSDILLNNIVYREYYPTFTLVPNTWLVTYLPTALVALLGSGLSQKLTVKRWLGAALTSTLMFFIVSNFFVWVEDKTLYSKTIEGLTTCYVAAIPFLKNQLMADLSFSALLFGSFEFARKQYIKLAY